MAGKKASLVPVISCLDNSTPRTVGLPTASALEQHLQGNQDIKFSRPLGNLNTIIDNTLLDLSLDHHLDLELDPSTLLLEEPISSPPLSPLDLPPPLSSTTSPPYTSPLHTSPPSSPLDTLSPSALTTLTATIDIDPSAPIAPRSDTLRPDIAEFLSRSWHHTWDATEDKVLDWFDVDLDVGVDVDVEQQGRGAYVESVEGNSESSEGEGEGEDEDEDDEDGGVELGLGLEEEAVREDVVRVAVDMGGWI